MREHNLPAGDVMSWVVSKAITHVCHIFFLKKSTHQGVVKEIRSQHVVLSHFFIFAGRAFLIKASFVWILWSSRTCNTSANDDRTRAFDNFLLTSARWTRKIGTRPILKKILFFSLKSKDLQKRVFFLFLVFFFQVRTSFCWHSAVSPHLILS